MKVTVLRTDTLPPNPEPVPSVQYYMQREDREVFGGIRTCAPCPAVFVVKDDPHTPVGQQWQYYWRAVNYNNSIENTFLLGDSALAFMNKTGFRHGFDPRQDWYHNKDLKAKPPQFDKVRTCSRNVVTGTEEYSLLEAMSLLWELGKTVTLRAASFRTVRHNFRRLLVSQNVLNVTTFDSNKLPPLKPGYSYPNDISEVDPNAYAVMPQYNPEMFVVANIVNTRGEVVQFPRGALYAWTQDNTPYSFVPLMSNPNYGKVLYPTRYLLKLSMGSKAPRPYRFN